MCIQVVERYTACRCVYYRHALDPCPSYKRRGHRTVVREVSVGHKCSEHSLGTDNNAANPTTVVPDIPEFDINRERQEAFPEIATSEHEAGLPLLERLCSKCQDSSDTAECFIASSDLEELLTKHAIEEELQRCKVEVPSSSVFPQATKVFAILLVIHRLDLIGDLLKSGVGDEHLPLQALNVTQSRDNALHSASLKWDVDTTRRFRNSQWIVLAPTFVEKEHLCLDDNARIPFIETKPIASGGFGGVHKVKIHSAHNNFGGPDNKGVSLACSRNVISAESPQANEYAVKQFVGQDAASSQRAFNHELSILKSLNHDHIVTLLGSFQYRNLYSMIFPLAREDLRQFWEHTSPSSISRDWFIEQMAGIASALSYLHTGVVAKDSRPMLGFHMDLRPDNILIMGDAGSRIGSWKISDFGLSHIRPAGLETDLPPHAGLGTYEAPECQLNLSTSQTSDIWSLGCIFAECAIWMLHGSVAIDTFAEDRLKDEETSSNVIKDDCFFTLKYDNQSLAPVGAMVRPAVLRWLHDLERNPSCDQTAYRLVLLIRDRLLRTTKVERMNAGDLSSTLERINKERAIPVMDQGTSSRLKSDAHIAEIED
ncbi:MAG: hypothetical protein Q9195_008525 [Heterodermia aff. obscurata]